MKNLLFIIFISYSMSAVAQNNCAKIESAFTEFITLNESAKSLELNKAMLLENCFKIAKNSRKKWLKTFVPNKKAAPILSLDTLEDEFKMAEKESSIIVQEGLIEVALDHATEIKEEKKSMSYIKLAKTFLRKSIKNKK